MQIVVTSASWVDLGPAPLNVMPQGSVYLYQGSAAPSSLLAATLIGGDNLAAAPSMAFYGTAHVFAIAPPAAEEAQIEADAIVVPPAASLTFPSSIAVTWSAQSVAVNNWPTSLAVNWSGQSVAVSNFPATQPVSVASLPALAAGANVIGAVTQSGGPWSVSWSGQSVAATQSGTWNIGSITTLPSLPAGANTIGAVTSIAALITAAPTVTQNSAYASGNCVGALSTIASGLGANGAATLVAALVNFKSAQTAQIDLIVFNANPTNTMFADKAAYSLNAADVNKVVAVVPLTSVESHGTPTTLFAQGVSDVIQADGSGNVYVLAVTRGTPTFSSTSDVEILLKTVK
jgi:hypothetical protein